MTLLEALILGIVQGFTEFFPVSSSAHLTLFKLLFNIKSGEIYVLFDLVCHLGTILASIIFLRKEITKLIRYDRHKGLLLIIAILPLVPIYFFGKPVRIYFSRPQFLGAFLILTSIMLFITSSIDIKESLNSSLNKKIKDVLFIGMMQAFALIPGISRSGSTISAACLRGWKMQEAIKFSFLLAIPTVLGGSLLESVKILADQKEPLPILQPKIYLLGFFSSLIIGFFTIKFIFSLVERKKIRPFAWYCLTIGVISLIYVNLVKL